MMNQKKKGRLAMIGFRADPRLLDEFESHCKDLGVTKSEAIRTIFSEHVVPMPPVQAIQNTQQNNVI